jgi:hypothetical protein
LTPLGSACLARAGWLPRSGVPADCGSRRPQDDGHDRGRLAVATTREATRSRTGRHATEVPPTPDDVNPHRCAGPAQLLRLAPGAAATCAGLVTNASAHRGISSGLCASVPASAVSMLRFDRFMDADPLIGRTLAQRFRRPLHRARRHGDGLRGVRREDPPRCRGEGAQARAVSRPDGHETLRTRGESGREARPPQHDPDRRSRGRWRRGLHRDGARLRVATS